MDEEKFPPPTANCTEDSSSWRLPDSPHENFEETTGSRGQIMQLLRRGVDGHRRHGGQQG